MSRRQYRSGSVFQRKDGMWVGRFEAGKDRNGNRRPITVYAATEGLCKEKLETRKMEVARDGIPEKGSGGKPPTIQEWASQWLKLVVDELAPKPYASSRSAINKWIVPTIGTRRLERLTAADLRAIQTAIREAGRKESTRLRVHSVTMSLLKDAVREGHHVPQSVLMAKPPKLNETDRLGLSFDEALTMLTAAAERPDGSKWAALLLQGIRKGERLGLTWSAIDWANDTIDISWQLQPLPYIDNKQKHLGFRVPPHYVHKHLYKRFHLVRPKTQTSRRLIPLTDTMRDALVAWRNIAPESDLALIWTTPEGLPIDEKDDLAEWKALQAEVGVAHPSGRPYVLHETRHATVTLLLGMGVPKDVVASIVGQTKLVEAYNHVDLMPAKRVALTGLAKQLALPTTKDAP